jgi:hypothetical protein
MKTESTEELYYEDVRASGGIAPPFLVSFSPLPGKGRYPLDRRLGGPHSQSGTRGEKKNLLPLSGIEPLPFSQQCIVI